jgi:CRISPR-associated protein (TIGR03984 family)
MSNDRILYSRAADNITLVDALKNCAGCFPDAVGLFYSPESCQFAKVQGDRVTDATGKDLDLNRVFEARIFDRQSELRWLNQPNKKGKAVLLSEIQIVSYLSEDRDTIESINFIDIIDSQYLLWGEGTGKTDENWSCISAARIGKLAVPIGKIARNDRVKLRFQEYLGVCDEHGNVAVVEERLMGLIRIESSKAK